MAFCRNIYTSVQEKVSMSFEIAFSLGRTAEMQQMCSSKHVVLCHNKQACQPAARLLSSGISSLLFQTFFFFCIRYFLIPFTQKTKLVQEEGKKNHVFSHCIFRMSKKSTHMFKTRLKLEDIWLYFIASTLLDHT